MTIILGVLCAGFCFSSATVSASVPYDVIPGLVLDEYGSPVQNATVTLWQDGQLWQPNETWFPGITNPQLSRSINNKEGSFLFGLLFPGQYTVTAEKYGYNRSAVVNIVNSTVHSPYSTNIVFDDFDAALSQKQVSYHGAIAGVIWDRHSEIMVRNAKVSLWQNGQMVKITGNPQNVVECSYSFKHLAPGTYEVRVETTANPSSDLITENRTVEVGTGNVTADIVMQYLVFSSLPPTTPTPVLPTPSTTPATPSAPAQTATSAQTATPVPSPGLIMILSSIGLAALFNRELRKSE
jgi:hypothetical protein